MRARKSSHPASPALLEALEGRQLMAADLMVEMGNFTPLSVYVPGDRINMPVVVRNNDSDAFSGRVRVQVESYRAGDDLRATSTVTTGIISIGPDASRFFTIPVDITDSFRPGDYTFILRATPLDNAGDTVPDQFGDDNSFSTDGLGTVPVQWKFGTVGTRQNVVMRMSDADGTLFSLALTGAGTGTVTPASSAMSFDVPYAIDLVAANTQAIGLTMRVVSSPGESNNTIDFFGTLDMTSDEPQYGTLGLQFLDAPALNWNGSIDVFSNPRVSASYLGGFEFLPELLARVNAGNIGGATINIRNLRGNLTVAGVARAITLNDISPLPVPDDSFSSLSESGTGIFVNTTFDRFGRAVGGLLGRLTMRDLNAGIIAVAGDSGPITARDVNIGQVNIQGGTTDLRFRNVDDGLISVGRTASSVRVSGELEYSQIDISNSAFGANSSLASTLSAGQLFLEFGQIYNVGMNINQHITSFTTDEWTVGSSSTVNKLVARSIGTLATRATGSGAWAADVFVVGGINRPNQLDRVTITGTLTGHFFVGGSVGTFIAQTVNTGTPADTDSTPVPTLAASGSIGAFTANSLISGIVWGTTINSSSVTITTNNAWFELAAGLRLSRTAIAEGTVEAARGSATFSNGTVGTYRAVIQAGRTGFVSRATAGVNARTAFRDYAGGARGEIRMQADGYLQTAGDSTVSRIGAIIVSGPASTQNLRFAFVTYPTTPFNFGTPAASVTLTNSASPNYNLIDLRAGTALANIFFRANRPD